jgi:dTDP-4-dehydrorhamnose reductase
MVTMPKVIAVVLTYNRKDLLKKCLSAVYAQSRKCDSVIVIDNASTDGTEQMLLAGDFPNLKTYTLSHNIGASGGFSAGFRVAYQDGADFVWMMDDDVIPDPDALERLLDADAVLERKEVAHAFLLSTAFTEEGLVTNTPSLDQRLNKIDYQNWPALLEHSLVPLCRATFVSILVPRYTLTEHGIPIASMFIWGEDSEYTLRVSQSRPGFLVGNSKVQHLRQKSGAINIVTEDSPTRIKYHRHYIRNEVFVLRKYYRSRRLVLFVLRHVSMMIKLLLKGEVNKAQIVSRGLTESMFYAPVQEPATAPLEALGVTARSPLAVSGAAEESQPSMVALEGLQTL